MVSPEVTMVELGMVSPEVTTPYSIMVELGMVSPEVDRYGVPRSRRSHRYGVPRSHHGRVRYGVPRSHMRVRYGVPRSHEVMSPEVMRVRYGVPRSHAHGVPRSHAPRRSTGDGNDTNIRTNFLLEVFRHLIAVHARKPDIEQHDLWASAAGRFDRVDAGRGDVCLMAGNCQKRGDPFAVSTLSSTTLGPTPSRPLRRRPGSCSPRPTLIGSCLYRSCTMTQGRTTSPARRSKGMGPWREPPPSVRATYRTLLLWSQGGERELSPGKPRRVIPSRRAGGRPKVFG